MNNREHTVPDRPVALITGGASGVGRAVARELHQRSHRVFLLDIQVDAAEGVARELSADGASAIAWKADVTDEYAVATAVEEAVRVWGRLDAVVNCAGAATGSAPLTDTTSELWQRTLAVNLMGPVHASRAAIPFLRSDGGAIVNVSSVAGVRARAELTAYCAAKAALVSLTQSLALELASDGIRVNCVAPGALETPMFDAFSRPGESPAEVRRRYVNGIPLGRLGTAEDIAHAVTFLTDGVRSSFVTGQVFVIDGGRAL
ncbi:SDR family NAD(P)-dependent oxidoreductase [Streptomyces iranensis]|uniref:3-oxoacyl-[acyl-carrier protein] reductase n=1 Tax=Streptomyces iranensis TaxID=576784 RepID=A0A061A662_9ACTN|nr:SDR family NAD(P)-dependent oxidoreductase [Streptomyces iranensis]MBP2066162.1 3-oxoacyl-[acyl-carrier protein] reductase [Streptomyces iranensis]CDR13165.1 short-chain dehydrogenase/reductase SDR [Streptomyces iranensis]